MRLALLLLPPLLAIAGCISAEGEEQDENTELSEESAADDETVDTGSEIKGGEIFGEYDARRDSYEGTRGESHGDGCTVDCGGHDAGYEWASEHDVSSADECGGKSWSFQEGCEAYAEENGG